MMDSDHAAPGHGEEGARLGPGPGNAPDNALGNARNEAPGKGMGAGLGISPGSSSSSSSALDTGAFRAAAPARPLAPNAVHLVRTSMACNLQLSQMADQKANMVMGAAFVVFTLSVGQFRAGTMLLPVAILAGGAMVAAIFAILSVLPKVTRIDGPIGDDANIMFFGIFTSLTEDAFIDRIVDRLDDDEKIYRTMLRDIYQNGQVLNGKKYRYLGFAYRAFLTGLCLSFIAFIAEWGLGRMV
ncbi:DUF5706 domain-containing protein [Sphingobium sp. H39-3-25]|uniref:Pycsar system effector family protein n=1 Tax=Sphingobium arseniciresistens TaxID=3030834 RepID=UPI0023B8B7BC|nr:DUF5706 domain-containing protein [Sphingobium arseniciresistens]